MADQVLTKQKLINADEDLGDLEEVLSGPPGKLVKTRLGRQVYTLASVPQINTMTREEVAAAVAPKANQADVDSAISGMNSTLNTSLANLSTDANKFYPTLAEANAAVASIAVNQPVTIGEVANGGLWYKATAGATSLTKSAYDPLALANQRMDENPRFLSANLTGSENLNDLPEGRYFIRSSTVANLLDSQLPSAATSPKIGWIDKVQNPNNLAKNSETSIIFTRYTQNSKAEYEIWRKTSNGGASSLVWLDWQKDPSRKEIDSALTLVGRYLTDGEDLNNLPDGRYFINPANWSTIINLPASDMTDPDIGVVICHRAPTSVGGTAYQEIIRYTTNPANQEIEKFERTGNGGSTISWLPWQKDVSRYEFDSFKVNVTTDVSDLKESKAEINLFPNYALTSQSSSTYQATLADENGYPTLTLNTSGVTLVAYDMNTVPNILDVGSTVSFSAEGFCDAIGNRATNI